MHVARRDHHRDLCRRTYLLTLVALKPAEHLLGDPLDLIHASILRRVHLLDDTPN